MCVCVCYREDMESETLSNLVTALIEKNDRHAKAMKRLGKGRVL